MRKHKNPYRVNDPDNLFEVSENSSHPELLEKKRIYDYNGRIFRTATELEKFMKNEGMDPRKYWIKPEWEQDTWGTIIRVRVVERVSQDERHKVRDFNQLRAV